MFLCVCLFAFLLACSFVFLFSVWLPCVRFFEGDDSESGRLDDPDSEVGEPHRARKGARGRRERQAAEVAHDRRQSHKPNIMSVTHFACFVVILLMMMIDVFIHAFHLILISWLFFLSVSYIHLRFMAPFSLVSSAIPCRASACFILSFCHSSAISQVETDITELKLKEGEVSHSILKLFHDHMQVPASLLLLRLFARSHSSFHPEAYDQSTLLSLSLSIHSRLPLSFCFSVFLSVLFSLQVMSMVNDQSNAVQEVRTDIDHQAEQIERLDGLIQNLTLGPAQPLRQGMTITFKTV